MGLTLALLLFAGAPSPGVRDIPVAPGEMVRTTVVGSGPPVVIVPGLVASAYAYRKVIPALEANGLRVIVVEPLGVGWSSRPSRADYSLTAQAGRIAAVLDSLGVRQATVMGHSLAVSMVLRLALMRPDLVSGIVANNGGPEEVAATSGVRKAARFALAARVGKDEQRLDSDVVGLVQARHRSFLLNAGPGSGRHSTIARRLTGWRGPRPSTDTTA